MCWFPKARCRTIAFIKKILMIYRALLEYNNLHETRYDTEQQGGFEKGVSGFLEGFMGKVDGVGSG